MDAAGVVFDIQKFSVHDGPGIRTTVFLKGCPLRCIWCHNPESWNAHPEILYSPEKCTACAACVSTCPKACHVRAEGDGTPRFGRDGCAGCGACARRCPSGALELCGMRRTPGEVLAEVAKDRPFYENSGGGLTLSGGEPMAQFAFARELLDLAKQNGLHTCMETCGFAPQERFREILPRVDLFLFDLKTVDPEKHRRLVGRDNAGILDNLRFLDAAGADIHLCAPLVAGLNDSEAELRDIALLAESLPRVRLIEVKPYHPLGLSKARRLGMPNGFAAAFTPAETVEDWARRIAPNTRVPVRAAGKEGG